MARGFGSTLGTGVTDIVKTVALTPHANTNSYWCWFNMHSHSGGSGLGRVFDQADSVPTSGRVVCFDNNANAATTMGFQRSFTTPGGWNWTGPPSLDSWTSLGVSYDEGLLSNNAIVYQAGVKLTAGSGLTATLPTGTVNAANGIMSIGGRASDTTRTFDGMIAEFATWNVILTDAEFAILAAGISPAMVRPQSLVEYVQLLRNNTSYKLAAPTITGTVVQPHPRIIMPRQTRLRKIPYVAPPFSAAWASGGNLPVLGTGTY